MKLDLIIAAKCYTEYVNRLAKMQLMYDYYKGDTDALKDYKFVTERSNLKTRVNYIKKFIKEEVSYTLGNLITYTSKSGDKNIIADIDYNLGHWKVKHNQALLKNVLIFGEAYELYYIDKRGQFSCRLLTPLNCFVLKDDVGDITMALYVFKKKFDTDTYIDLILPDRVIHFKNLVAKENFISEDPHYFGEVPMSVCTLSEELEEDTMFQDLKGLQDAYETNLSDICNEISDFRNAYLTFIGAELKEDDLPKMKELGVMNLPNKDGKVAWLIKEINDDFIQNTLGTLEDKMYQISGHINANEKLSSNTSSLALRTRLITLENNCSLDFGSITDCVKTRLRMLFIVLKLKQSKEYDYRDIDLVYSPNIPQDDLMTAQIIQQLGDKLSLETGLSQLSFVSNPQEEIKKIESDQSNNLIGLDLLTGANK